LVENDIGQASLQAAQSFFRGLALESFPFVVAAPRTIRLANLGHGHHVQGVVQASVAGSREAVSDLLAGGGVDGRGAVVGREVVSAGEAVDVVYLGQDPSGDDGPNTVELGEAGAAGIDEAADLAADDLDLVVQDEDVVKMLPG
jgi:hypothetical protein